MESIEMNTLNKQCPGLYHLIGQCQSPPTLYHLIGQCLGPSALYYFIGQCQSLPTLYHHIGQYQRLPTLYCLIAQCQNPPTLYHHIVIFYFNLCRSIPPVTSFLSLSSSLVACPSLSTHQLWALGGFHASAW